MLNTPKIIVVLWFSFCFISCQEEKTPLPYLGNKIIENGVEKYYKVGQFEHLNQDSIIINNAKMADYIYVVDFFFTSCPSICPKVMKEMLKINEATKNEPMVKLVSFTIDPKRDNVAKLKFYADNLDVDHNKWYFLTGDKEKTYALAETYFMPTPREDASVPGGFDHSGKLILVDKEGHVRSFSEGTDPSETPKIINDINRLIAEYKEKPTK